jgi:hypothetical protein
VPLTQALKQRRVQVGRLFPALPNQMRVTIGKKSEMEAFLSAFRQITAWKLTCDGSFGGHLSQRYYHNNAAAFRADFSCAVFHDTPVFENYVVVRAIPRPTRRESVRIPENFMAL